ncbi:MULTISPECIES: hypothetical protein [unclassified Rhodanobacter]|uniref:hypothetical protein n=1 Tax=unclassified Rhodanobacter TaxID=2621553 RepID=UPI0007AA3499|nr:hypothetical protein [Rhodanobacter sp. FW510-R10]KZC32554.1 hypothetical protein RhoFW510R10_11600 [Rhodanobacter sp. FW510-R10]
MNEETQAPLIGIAGFKRAGKDTLARAIRQLNGYDIVGFSDAIVAELEAITGFEITDTMKEQPVPGMPGVTFRDLLVRHGTYRRRMLKSYWIDKMAATVATSLIAGRGVIVTGVRLMEEFHWIRSNGGQVIWLDRRGFESDGTYTEANQAHVCDVRIVNDGDIDAVACRALDRLQKHREFLRRAA